MQNVVIGSEDVGKRCKHVRRFKQMQGISVETEQLLHKTNALADDIQQKSQSLNKVVGCRWDWNDNPIFKYEAS